MRLTSRDIEPPYQRPQKRHLTRAGAAAAAFALSAALVCGPLVSGAQARSTGYGAGNKFAGAQNISWNGMQISLWTVPGVGLHAYQIRGPANLASGWRYCENQFGVETTVAQCLGVPAAPAR